MKVCNLEVSKQLLKCAGKAGQENAFPLWYTLKKNFRIVILICIFHWESMGEDILPHSRRQKQSTNGKKEKKEIHVLYEEKLKYFE